MGYPRGGLSGTGVGGDSTRTGATLSSAWPSGVNAMGCAESAIAALLQQDAQTPHWCVAAGSDGLPVSVFWDSAEAEFLEA